MRTFNAKPPVKPIGRILYSECYSRHWDPDMGKSGGYRSSGYKQVCECRGFSDDRPFAIFKYEREVTSDEKPPKQTDPKPFKVTFHWTHDKPKKVKVRRMGEEREEYDNDTYYMIDVLEEHETLSAAKKAMRRFAKAAFDKVNESRPKELGEVCNCMGANDCKLRLGDLVECTSNPGIVWRILSERKTVHDWSLKVEPVFAFLVDNGTDQIKEISQRDVNWYVKPLDIVKLGTLYSKLGMTIADEARRRSQ